ncbi:hypothetical protein N482_18245 [Pseudoalteromonas luteoviolacea NCIMB 1942]|uniref:Dipeptidylpeptidase IV N-terminal domain-containing protein n=1 Tax=Pseudoalteromonas luteoviolacea NCIMB 1942 TaxID=1365253 RepID=A0A166Z632_9GAMM|nr:hypothetical protein N482_18245 [Pseudoalteromonas luteoviolacea NCIMB 1942]
MKVIDVTRADGYPEISPNAKHIAFYGKYDNFKTWSIHVVDINRSNLKRLTDTKNVWDSAPPWLADGEIILFTREYKNDQGEWQGELWTMKRDCSEQIRHQALHGGLVLLAILKFCFIQASGQEKLRLQT